MAPPRGEVLQGTLDLLILKTLARGPEHGYGITCCILAASQNQLRVEEGSLYPALRRMEAQGLIKAEWKASENNRRAPSIVAGPRSGAIGFVLRRHQYRSL